jgi:hypothetical protein
MISNSFKNEKRPPNSHEFWSEEVHCLKIKNFFMSQHYNCMCPMQLGAVIVCIQVQEGKLKILQLLS